MTHDEYDELMAAAQELASGKHGSFAAFIGDALMAADMKNADRLRRAFPELIDLVLN